MAKSMRWARKMGEKYWQAKIEKKKENKNREGFLGC
jgi:hypothetical protein